MLNVRMPTTNTPGNGMGEKETTTMELEQTHAPQKPSMLRLEGFSSSSNIYVCSSNCVTRAFKCHPSG